MKHTKLVAIAFLGLALAAAGCGKKADDEQALSGTGFDALSSTDELAQLPGSNQASVEMLPIEATPVTQTAPAAPVSMPADVSGLSRDQQIQTALKNAGLYEGNIDGKVGPKTKQAIEQFQANQGLKVDGKVGPKTWAALEPYLTGQATSTTTSAE